MGTATNGDYRGHASETPVAVDEHQALTTDICSSIIVLSHLVERYANARLPSFGLPAGMTVPRVKLLMAVANGMDEAISTRMSDIALDLGVTSRTITTMVDALEREGLIERVPDLNDRRAISLVLTDEGRACVPRIRRALDEISASVLAPLSGRDHQALHELLTRLIDREN